jgi:hypothetical protein
MKRLLEKYEPPDETQNLDDLPFGDIVKGEQLWAKQYPLEVGRFIGGRKRE